MLSSQNAPVENKSIEKPEQPVIAPDYALQNAAAADGAAPVGVTETAEQPVEVSEVPLAGALMRNPLPDTVLNVAPGGRIEVLWDFVNHSPFVASFYLEVEGLPSAQWASGAGEASSTVVPAHGGGALILVIAPPVDALPQNVPLQVRVMSNGRAAIDTSLQVQVTADASTVFDSRLATKVLSVPENETEIENHVIRKELPLVDLPVDVARGLREVEDGQAVNAYAEPSVLEPAEGTVLPMRPGETLLLRFLFTNETPYSRTYDIEEDRSLETDWLTLVQDQVNITKGESGELTLRIHPPANARPGHYPFGVRVGPEGGTLLPRGLILHVLATPSLRLKVPSSQISVGPFRRTVEIPFDVESAGNADTAFRMAVKSPQKDGEQLEAARSDIYESRRWRYYFEREMDSLVSLSTNRPPKPRPQKLKVVRKGIWWFGFREAHRVRVAAVPVTDPHNGDKSGHIADVTAVRWRPYPLPLRLLLPLVGLPLLLMLGKAENLMIDNPTYISPNGTNWIVADPSKHDGVLRTKLRWQAPPLSILAISATGDDAFSPRVARSPQTLEATFPLGQRSLYSVYQVGRLWGGGPQIKTRFVAARADTPLLMRDALNRVVSGTTVQVKVPMTGRITLKLSNTALQDNALNYWVAKRPGPAFYVNDLNDEGSIKPLTKYGDGATQTFKITRGATGQAGAEDELILVTTDASRPVLRLKLKLVYVGGANAPVTP
jgi:hypothetical protein